VGLTLRHDVLSLALRDPFRIARSEPGAGTRVTTVIVELRDDRFPELVGLGEGYPDAFYGETPETSATATSRIRRLPGCSPASRGAS
jgi:L-alanine-DL-glutamate epimerase-like enolase superfamily enzyme